MEKPSKVTGLKIDKAELDQTLQNLHKEILTIQKDHHVDHIPTGDFSLYDHVLDTSLLFNIIPERFQGRPVDDDLLFDIARGNKDHVASALIKWFNTNYHYIVPEWDNVSPQLNNNVLLEKFNFSKEVGVTSHPVILGPVTYVALSKGGDQSFDEKVRTLLPLYKEVFEQLTEAGAEYIQVDEPILVTDGAADLQDITKEAYEFFNEAAPAAKLVLQTYFERVDLNFVGQLPVYGFGLDFVHDNGFNLQQIKDGLFPKEKALFAGIVDGRNVWSTNIEEKKDLIETLQSYTDELVIQPSSSLLHVPVTLEEETLDDSVREGLSFATEKLDELYALKQLFNENDDTLYNELKEQYERFESQSFKQLEYNYDSVKSERTTPFKERKVLQDQVLNLPDLPTTTIGSFPQSREVRKYRADWKTIVFQMKNTKNSYKMKLNVGLKYKKKLD